jgi:hypothetical protein
LLVTFVLASTVPAGADVIPAPSGSVDPYSNWRLAVGPVAGAVLPDQSLANYRWDTRAAVATGLQATVYHRRLAAGLRLSKWHSSQATGIPGVSEVPRVNVSAIDLIGSVRAVHFGPAELWGSAHVGRTHLGYDPDAVTFDPGVGGAVTIDFDPIWEWDYGLGAEVRAELTRQLALGLQAEMSTFALDTAHRVGSEIVEQRESFTSFSLRLQASWIVQLD